MLLLQEAAQFPIECLRLHLQRTGFLNDPNKFDASGCRRCGSTNGSYASESSKRLEKKNKFQ